MKTALLVSAALLVLAVTLSACQSNTTSGDVEKYKRDHDRYMRTHEPKTGGPDL
jgi:outer membrane lipoprotein SlyB